MFCPSIFHYVSHFSFPHKRMSHVTVVVHVLVRLCTIVLFVCVCMGAFIQTDILSICVQNTMLQQESIRKVSRNFSHSIKWMKKVFSHCCIFHVVLPYIAFQHIFLFYFFHYRIHGLSEDDKVIAQTPTLKTQTQVSQSVPQ